MLKLLKTMKFVKNVSGCTFCNFLQPILDRLKLGNFPLKYLSPIPEETQFIWTNLDRRIGNKK